VARCDSSVVDDVLVCLGVYDSVVDNRYHILCHHLVSLPRDVDEFKSQDTSNAPIIDIKCTHTIDMTSTYTLINMH